MKPYVKIRKEFYFKKRKTRKSEKDLRPTFAESYNGSHTYSLLLCRVGHLITA